MQFAKIFDLIFKEDDQETVVDFNPVSSFEGKENIVHLGKVVLGSVAEGDGLCDKFIDLIAFGSSDRADCIFDHMFEHEEKVNVL